MAKKFSSDAERKAAMANMNNNNGGKGPKISKNPPIPSDNNDDNNKMLRGNKLPPIKDPSGNILDTGNRLDDIIEAEVRKRIDDLMDDDDAYEEYLDEVPGLLDDYTYSQILKETDDVMYRTGLNDHVDSLLQDEAGDIESKAEQQADEEIHDDPKKFGLTEADFKADTVTSPSGVEISLGSDKYHDILTKRTEELDSELTDERMDELMNDTDQYDESLDETNVSDVDIGSPGRVLKDLDPIAFRVGKADWADGESDRLNDEVRDEIDEELSIKKSTFVGE